MLILLYRLYAVRPFEFGMKPYILQDTLFLALVYRRALWHIEENYSYLLEFNRLDIQENLPRWAKYIRCPYKGFLTLEEELDNGLWAQGLESMERGFDEVSRNFKAVSLDMEKNVGTGRLYRVGTILSNCLTCLNQESFTSNIFGVKPPTLEQYINRHY